MNNEIINRLERIETKLDNVIKALHDYDEGTLHCEYSGLPSVEAYSDEEYGESSFEAFMDTKTGPCSKHDEASWDEEEAERRMNIIGQNGNEGLHYGVEGDNDNDIQDEHVGVDKDKRTGGDKKKYYNKYSKTKQSKVDNQKYIKTKDSGRL